MLGFFKRNASFFAALSLIFIVRGTFADQNVVPSGSMLPTIHIGDHILVDKTAYDLRLPYTGIRLFANHDPKRGDIIVFFNPQNDVRMVKRLVGLPGDHIHIENGIATVNGVTESQEHIQRIPSLEREESLDYAVPEDHYFAMGDNRDNSFDSRGWGFIPRANIQGKAVGVIYNLAWTPLPNVEWNRIAKSLD